MLNFLRGTGKGDMEFFSAGLAIGIKIIYFRMKSNTHFAVILPLRRAQSKPHSLRSVQARGLQPYSEMALYQTAQGKTRLSVI